jgi:small subunit ribosomal protein S19
MSRSLYKGPYINEKILKKVQGKKAVDTGVIKVWDRASVITPEMVGFTFGVHNGKTQKELETKRKEAEVAAAKAAKAAPAKK